jgi:hypothetical protein
LCGGKGVWAQNSSGWYADHDERRLASITDSKGVAFTVFDNLGHLEAETSRPLLKGK